MKFDIVFRNTHCCITVACQEMTKVQNEPKNVAQHFGRIKKCWLGLQMHQKMLAGVTNASKNVVVQQVETMGGDEKRVRQSEQEEKNAIQCKENL